MRTLPLILPLLILLPILAKASSIELDGLTENDVNRVGRDFSAIFSHTTVSPAGGLMRPTDFELGFVAGMASIPNIEAVSERQSTRDASNQIPHYGFIGLYQYSEKLTFETKWTPLKHIDDVTISSLGFGVKIQNKKSDLNPITTATSIHITNSRLLSPQSISNATTGGSSVDADLKFNSINLGATYFIGYRHESDSTFIEPYFGVGGVYSQTTLECVNASNASVFASESPSAKANQLGLNLFLGMQIYAYFSKFGIEYNRIYDSNRLNLKFAIGY